MHALFASIVKELLLLRRDKAGLLLLFVMPAVLVLVITLVQENVLKLMGESTVRVLLVDNDTQAVGHAVTDLLSSGSYMVDRADVEMDRQSLIGAVLEGDYQFAVLVPAAMSDSLTALARELASDALGLSGTAALQEPPPELTVYFDPAVLAGFRAGTLGALTQVVSRVEIEEKMRAFAELLPERVGGILREAMGAFAPQEFALPALDLAWVGEPVLRVSGRVASLRDADAARIPSSVQQNVPAWALFGMFFIVVPMASTLIRERLDGTLRRVLVMPVSPLNLLAGKVVAYLLVCCCQFALILVIGTQLLPLLGTPALVIGSEWPALLVMIISVALAAAGYGILLGVLARTYEQASMFGSISVVIAAAIGGIMVPVYAMPKVMQQISVLSPLAWGLNGFQDIFVRQGGGAAIMPEASLLLSFFIATLLVAWFAFYRRVRNG